MSSINNEQKINEKIDCKVLERIKRERIMRIKNINQCENKEKFYQNLVVYFDYIKKNKKFNYIAFVRNIFENNYFMIPFPIIVEFNDKIYKPGSVIKNFFLDKDEEILLSDLLQLKSYSINFKNNLKPYIIKIISIFEIGSIEDSNNFAKYPKDVNFSKSKENEINIFNFFNSFNIDGNKLLNLFNHKPYFKNLERDECNKKYEKIKEIEYCNSKKNKDNEKQTCLEHLELESKDNEKNVCTDKNNKDNEKQTCLEDLELDSKADEEVECIVVNEKNKEEDFCKTYKEEDKKQEKNLCTKKIQQIKENKNIEKSMCKSQLSIKFYEYDMNGDIENKVKIEKGIIGKEEYLAIKPKPHFKNGFNEKLIYFDIDYNKLEISKNYKGSRNYSKDELIKEYVSGGSKSIIGGLGKNEPFDIFRNRYNKIIDFYPKNITDSKILEEKKILENNNNKHAKIIQEIISVQKEKLRNETKDFIKKFSKTEIPANTNNNLDKKNLELGENEKIIIFGTYNGNFLSIFRNLCRLKKKNIIDNNFKLSKNYKLLFLGNIFNNYPFLKDGHYTKKNNTKELKIRFLNNCIEIILLLFTLIKQNNTVEQEKVFLIKGPNENNYFNGKNETTRENFLKEEFNYDSNKANNKNTFDSYLEFLKKIISFLNNTFYGRITINKKIVCSAYLTVSNENKFIINLYNPPIDKEKLYRANETFKNEKKTTKKENQKENNHEFNGITNLLQIKGEKFDLQTCINAINNTKIKNILTFNKDDDNYISKMIINLNNDENILNTENKNRRIKGIELLSIASYINTPYLVYGLTKKYLYERFSDTRKDSFIIVENNPTPTIVRNNPTPAIATIGGSYEPELLSQVADTGVNLPKNNNNKLIEIKDYIKLINNLFKRKSYKYLFQELQTSRIGNEYKIVYYLKFLNSKKGNSVEKLKNLYFKIVAKILDLFNLKLTKKNKDLNIDLYHYLLITKLNGKSYKFFKSDKLNDKLNTKKKYIRHFYVKHIESQDKLKKSFYYKLMQYINISNNPNKAIYKYTNISKKKEIKEFLIEIIEKLEDEKLKNKYIVDLFGECILPSIQFYGKL